MYALDTQLTYDPHEHYSMFCLSHLSHKSFGGLNCIWFVDYCIYLVDAKNHSKCSYLVICYIFVSKTLMCLLYALCIVHVIMFVVSFFRLIRFFHRPNHGILNYHKKQDNRSNYYCAMVFSSEAEIDIKTHFKRLHVVFVMN